MEVAPVFCRRYRMFRRASAGSDSIEEYISWISCCAEIFHDRLRQQLDVERSRLGNMKPATYRRKIDAWGDPFDNFLDDYVHGKTKRQ